MSELEGFHKACSVNEIKEGFGKRVLVDDVDVAIFKSENKIYALSNICPHQHTALMYDGFVEGDKVACPLHGWEFNLEDGCMANGRKGLDKYEVKIVEDDVYIKVFEKKLNWDF